MLPCTYFGLRPYGSVINTGLKSLMLLGVDLSLLQSVTGMTFFSHSLNGVCWFLSCIFVCYIVMAFIIKKIDNIRSKREAEVCFLISIIIVLLLSLAASKIEQMNLSGGKINDLWYGHPAIRWWYLLIGAILGTLYKKTDIEFGTLTEVGITAVACVYFVLRNTLLEIMNQNFLRFFDLLLCSMVLFGFSKGTGFISQALSNNRMLWLSRTTMYLYLFHYPVRALVDNFFVEINAISTLGIKISGDTVIRLLLKRYQAMEHDFIGDKIGIDDFAYKKRHTYGTIIVDEETHNPITLLDGRDGDSLREWLKNNKHIKVITRDRASAYAKVIAEELPDAMQVADRFHLHQNLLEAIKKALNHELPATVKIPHDDESEENHETGKKNRTRCG